MEFRDMRRKRQQLSDEESIGILKKAARCCCHADDIPQEAIDRVTLHRKIIDVLNYQNSQSYCCFSFVIENNFVYLQRIIC